MCMHVIMLGALTLLCEAYQTELAEQLSRVGGIANTEGFVYDSIPRVS